MFVTALKTVREEEDSYFQFEAKGFQFTQMECNFELCIAQLFKQTHCTKIKLDLREVILLDSQSMMDWFATQLL